MLPSGVGFARQSPAVQPSPGCRLHCFQSKGEINFAEKLKLVQTHFSNVFFRQAIKPSVIMGLYHEIIKTQKVFLSPFCVTGSSSSCHGVWLVSTDMWLVARRLLAGKNNQAH